MYTTGGCFNPLRIPHSPYPHRGGKAGYVDGVFTQDLGLGRASTRPRPAPGEVDPAPVSNATRAAELGGY